ncbi:hypothetical protein AB0D04_31670 [Streptomyces sp. NPDC048483]|uniref:hypothetical protein n=1 Tax=Streptomyces sp. NPDC048483 TaxID=3154927 RepID=UPI0034313220
MTDSPHFALRLALRLADPDTADALAERLRPELLAALSDRFGLPAKMIEELLDGDAAHMRAALTIDPEEWLLGAAELGDPVVGRALWDANYRDDSGHQQRAMAKVPDLLATLLYAADLSDPRWYEDDGLCHGVHDVTEGPLLVTVLTSGFLGVTLGSIALFGAHLPPGAVVDACLNFQEIWGTEAIPHFLDLLEEVPDLDIGHPWLPELLRQALDAPDAAAFLKAHRPAGWTDPEHLRALLELRHGDRVPAKPGGLEWDLILREHERLPFESPTDEWGFQETGMLRLVQWEGCPADLVREAFRNAPYETAWHAAELPLEVLAAPGVSDIERNRTLERGINEGWLSPHRVLSEVTPAAKVLGALPYDHEPARKAVADLVAPLGTDPVNWLTCYTRMGRARGSAAELIADVTRPGSRLKRRTSWPRPRAAEIPVREAMHSRAAFLRMVRCASQEAQIAVVPHFDPLAAQQFLLECDPSPAVRDTVAAAHGLPAQLAVAAGNPDATMREYLLDLDEPEVDVQLFRHDNLSRPERERVLAGRLRGGGIRPVPAELLRLLDDLVVSQNREGLAAGVGSGDLGVARRVVGRLRLHAPATRLRLLIAVWERGGPDAVREILAMDRLPVTLRRRTEKLLDAPDGLDRMRARLAEEAEPDRLAKILTRSGAQAGKRLRLLRDEGIQPPWPALVAAHRATPLPADLVEALVELPDCPREVLLAGLGNAHGHWTNWLNWIRPALSQGTLALEDLLTHVAPAQLALDFLLRCVEERNPGEDRPTEEDWQRLRDRAAALTREHLGTDVDAPAVCLQLLPTFTGTLSELAATAGAMTRAHV